MRLLTFIQHDNNIENTNKIDHLIENPGLKSTATSHIMFVVIQNDTSRLHHCLSIPTYVSQR